MADVIVIRSDLHLQETLHICFILFRSHLCKNLRIFLKNSIGAESHNEKICSGSSAHLCAINFNLCRLDADYWNS